MSGSQLGDEDMGQEARRGEGAPGRGSAEQRLGYGRKPVSAENGVVPPGPGDGAGQVGRDETPLSPRNGREPGTFPKSTEAPSEASQLLEEALGCPHRPWLSPSMAFESAQGNASSVPAFRKLMAPPGWITWTVLETQPR